MILNLLARFLAVPRVADWLIGRAMRTPYYHLEGYQERYWLFNAHDPVKRWSWLPSMRIHHILREDRDRHLHDHPWRARSFILKGEYWERRHVCYRECSELTTEEQEIFWRRTGTTASIPLGTFHSIDRVSVGGVWTLFVMFGYSNAWGFDVDGVKVPWREYLKVPENKP